MTAFTGREFPDVTTTDGRLAGSAGVAGLATGAIGIARPRIEGRAKVTGSARYAADEPVRDLAFGSVVLSTVSRGRILDIDVSAVRDMPGVLDVIDHRNAPRLNPAAGHFFGPDGGLRLLQDDAIPYAGRPVALVVAETLEQAQAAAEALPVTYEEQPHDTDFSADHPAARPALALFDGPANIGDVEAELAASAVVVDERYRTPEEHCSAMEPHSATAWWEGEHLQAIDSNQGPFYVASVLATLFSLSFEQVRIRTEHVGGGFGSKGLCGPQLILAVMATMRSRRPVRVTLTRDQVFLTTALRPETDQSIRIGADADGRLRAIHHEAAFELSPLAEYIEGCTELTKTLYAASAIRTRLTAVPLDILPPYSMRGPGAAPGSFALESAMDELAERLGIDPLELRLRNEPTVGPISGLPFSSRNLVACLREGARRFGWATRDHRPRMRREGRLLVGTGLAATSFSAGAFPSSASITAEPDGTFTVAIGATDLGTGARTALTAIAADALAVGTEGIRLRISDSDLGPAWSAGGSRGTTSWAWAITEAAARLRDQPRDPARPVTVTVDTTQLLNDLPARERHSYSAVFAEVTVDPATGEVRVRRLLGMFAVGRVVNPLMARSQVIGGMIGGLSMALHEEGIRDPVSGRHINADFAGYHIAAHADVPDIEADFVPDYEPGIPLGIKGAGEIGNVGTAAAIANAVWHATGFRRRTLPIRLDRVLEEYPLK
ncbi:xanthine dehydrogenase family protein molybdopterin-binding subunit [Streptosporangium sp. NBC_01810]|uniref:xanthine dehydrogenase family protein molybdopterin-binding subunit n=1 Tax=Streptosporangium sp. NBC_01810 TaxID=2975951 RepID=UPI002DD8E682|nr:xanthine dehydrogenase family protein molybdopterin-binding subunit [Streptosporangium sp. NBC_01810]WSA25423.1 xanthine dehydrogenase family protein molybdopterin-binding subunit [Streptosporangium sp. NBC_01810]